jgi:signal transduction histidine kinase
VFPAHAMPNGPGGPAHGAAGLLRGSSAIDVVGDRHRLLLIGMAAVWVACLIFAPARFFLWLNSGRMTPWWINLAGAIAVPLLYHWYRQRPRERSAGALHGTALIATIALLVPVLYGMTSTIWWLSLVGFAAILLGRRREALLWGTAIPITVVAAHMIEPFVQLEGAAGEPELEHVLARSIFVILLVVMAAAFRVVAEQRAALYHDSEERFRLLFDRAPIGVFRYGPELRITVANARFMQTLVGDGDLAGIDLAALDRDGSRLLPALRAALAGEDGAYDGPCQCSRGGERHISLRTAPLHDTDGNVVGAIGTLEDVTERRRIEEELRHTSDRLRALSRRLVQVQEAERRAIALELHDEAGQTLTAINLQLAELEKLSGGSEDEARRRQELLRSARGAIVETMESLHELSARLRPAALDRMGLPRAVEQLAERARVAGIEVRVELAGVENGTLPPEIEVTVYRAVQEAVTNALRHSRAHTLEIRIVRSGTRLALLVADDGIGFDVASARRGNRLGLAGMAERLELVGGSLTIESRPGSGTRVVAEVELSEGAAPAR